MGISLLRQICYNQTMIKIVDNDIWRNGEKIGYLRNYDVFNHEGKKLGYFRDTYVYNYEGRKIGYIQDDFLKTIDGQESRLENNRVLVEGHDISDIQRSAVLLLLGS